MSTELMVKLLKNGDTPPLRNLSTHNISFPLFFPIHGISFWDCFRILANTFGIRLMLVNEVWRLCLDCSDRRVGSIFGFSSPATISLHLLVGGVLVVGLIHPKVGLGGEDGVTALPLADRPGRHCTAQYSIVLYSTEHRTWKVENSADGRLLGLVNLQFIRCSVRSAVSSTHCAVHCKCTVCSALQNAGHCYLITTIPGGLRILLM